MKDLNYQLMKLCKANRDGSFSTQATRRRILDRIANQLHELGYKHMQAKSLKPKHVEALVSLWKDQGFSVGTLKNLLSGLRWWARHVGKDDMIPKDNNAFDIGKRSQVAEESKAWELKETQLERISDPYVRLSLRLQAAFGLQTRGSHQVLTELRDQGRSHQAEGQLDQGRSSPNRADPDRRATATPRGRQETRQGRRADPAEQELRRATASLRPPGPQCGHQEPARPPARLRPAALRGTDRLEGAGRRWPSVEIPHHRSTRA